MKKKQVYLSTVSTSAGRIAREYGLGLEIAEYCTADNMDIHWKRVDSAVCKTVWGVDRVLFHAPYNELFPCAIDSRVRDLTRQRYRQAITTAVGYRSYALIIHSGYMPQFYYDCWFEEKSIAFWKDFLKTLPDGIVLYLENVFDTRPEPLLHVLEAVNDPRLRVCLDIGHVNAYSKVPVMQWLERLAPWISHFHLHNNQGDGDTHSPLTEGTIPMAELLREAGRLCPDATYTLELSEPEPSIAWLLNEGLLE